MPHDVSHFTVLLPVVIAGQSVSALFPAQTGCAMAHCDPMMSDNANTAAPLTQVHAYWHDTTVTGSNIGLGCSSNSSIAVCTLLPNSTATTTLKAYTASGSSPWSSTLLNNTAPYSAPMVNADGSVIAADSEKVFRLNPDGSPAWITNTPGGIPISPTTTGDNSIILATLGGPVSAYDANTGVMLASLAINASINDNGVVKTGIFDTANTPTIQGNRIYISTQFHETATGAILPYGRLYALDLMRTGETAQLSIAWFYEFQAPSGASPLLIQTDNGTTIYFDGNGVIPGGSVDPHTFAVVDKGDHGELVWSYQMPTRALAGAARDPRGGLWIFVPQEPYLIRLDQTTGTELQQLDVGALINESVVYWPSSAMSISGTATQPVMIVSTRTATATSSYLIAIDLSAGTLLWKFRYDEGKGFDGHSYGQFPIVTSATGQPVVVFTTSDNGTWAFGQ
ncbi:MAG: PQQ-like beta-propeller repeat protein [Herpetosiphonaceae bacterium]|nr:PQQ-like beta-propeller repeat protein [Herpetosiphonaceae bacterium]